MSFNEAVQIAAHVVLKLTLKMQRLHHLVTTSRWLFSGSMLAAVKHELREAVCR